jgi:sarcosine oxidase subunit alpha
VKPQVVVAGGGPAGLAAATSAARAGATVLLCEERPVAGGQLRYRVQPVVAAPGGHAERPWVIAERLLTEASSAGVEIRTGALVAGCFGNRELLVVEDDRAWNITPDVVIVATGSTDLPYPCAGATFPGVFAARGLQILLNQHRVRLGRHFAVIGGGDDAEEVALDILLAGGEVIWSGIAPAPLLRAEGQDGVRALVVGQDRFDVDIIAIAVGRQADPALATMAGVPLAFNPALGGLVPIVDDRQESRIPGLFVSGDAAGVGSVSAAIAEGTLAGVAAAASLALVDDEAVATARGAGGPELAWRHQHRAILPVQSIHAQPYE